MSAAAGDLVVLLHGLSRTRLSMRRMAQAVARAGFEAHNWDYPSRRHTVSELVAMLRARLTDLPADGSTVHFVGHSLGGILVRAALREGVPCRAGRLVMLAPPNNGAGIVNRFDRVPALLRVMGRPAHELRRGASWLAGLGPPPVETGIIAGTRGFDVVNPTSWLNALLGAHERSDGTVELDSTRLPGMRDYLAIDAAHSFICDNPVAIRQTVHFLQHGRFAA